MERWYCCLVYLLGDRWHTLYQSQISNSVCVTFGWLAFTYWKKISSSSENLLYVAIFFVPETACPLILTSLSTFCLTTNPYHPCHLPWLRSIVMRKMMMASSTWHMLLKKCLAPFHIWPDKTAVKITTDLIVTDSWFWTHYPIC